MDAVGLLEKARGHLKARPEDRERHLLAMAQARQRVMAQGAHLELADRILDEQELRRRGAAVYRPRLRGDGLRTGVVYAAARGAESARLEAGNRILNERFLGPSSQPPPEDIAAEVAADIAYRDLTLWNAPLYVLADTDPFAAQLKPGFRLDSFFNFRYGVGALWDEAVQAVADVDGDVARVLGEREKLLPFRTHFAPTVPSFLDLKTKLCGGGISLLLAFRRSKPFDDYALVLQRRAPKLAAGAGALGVYPHAYHQPSVSPAEEFGLVDTALREIYEELFDGEEVQRAPRHLMPHHYLSSSTPMKWLDTNRDKWDLYCTAFGLYTLSPGYDAAMLLVVQESSFWEKFSPAMMACWEVDGDLTPVVSSRDDRTIEALLRRKEWFEGGLASFARGLTTLAIREPGRTSLPEGFEDDYGVSLA